MSALTAYVELKGVDKLSGPLAKARARFGHFAKKLRDQNSAIGKSFAKAKKSFGNFSKKLQDGDFNEGLLRNFKRMSLVGGALAAGGLYKVVQAGAEFQTSMADLSAITGVAGKDLDFLRGQALKLSRDSIMPATQVAEAFKLVASAKSELLEDMGGFNEVTKQVLLLSNASGMDLASAATVATQSMNQFGLGAEDASRAVNVFAAGSKIGASEVVETGAAIVKAGVAARKAKVSFEETNSAIQVLASGGIRGAEAGTMLRNIFNRLEKQTNRKFKPSVVGFNQALENLSKANLSTAKSMKLFGEEADSGATILIRDRALVGDWTKAITGTGVASEQAAKRMETLGKKAGKLKESLKAGAITFFDELKPSMERAMDFMQKNLDQRAETKEFEKKDSYENLKKFINNEEQFEVLEKIAKTPFKKRFIEDKLIQAFGPEKGEQLNKIALTEAPDHFFTASSESVKNYRAEQISKVFHSYASGSKLEQNFDPTFDNAVRNIGQGIKLDEFKQNIADLNKSLLELRQAVSKQEALVKNPQEIRVTSSPELQVKMTNFFKTAPRKKNNLGELNPS